MLKTICISIVLLNDQETVFHFCYILTEKLRRNNISHRLCACGQLPTDETTCLYDYFQINSSKYFRRCIIFTLNSVCAVNIGFINDAVNEIAIKHYKKRFDRCGDIRHFTKMAVIQIYFLICQFLI